MRISTCVLTMIFAAFAGPLQGDDLRERALAVAKKATRFLTEQVSTRGGYLWAYSADLKLREGEGVVSTETIWVQPPGTPSVGEAFVRLYQASGDAQFLLAAQQAAEALRHGQMRSGGWQASVEFDPSRSKRWSYRSLPPSKKSKDQSSLDDAKTQATLRFLIRLDEALQFKSDTIHEMTRYALDGLIQKGQFAGGGFPHVWTNTRSEDDEIPLLRASFPTDWPRVYPGHRQYWTRYTLNDHLALDVMEVLLLADRVYQDARYLQSAKRLGDSLIAAQLPLPQPAWAQQYDQSMQPIWARKFEPPAITSSESFTTIEALMLCYQATGELKYLEPIEPAIEYLKSCEFEDGTIARFYELETNRPLYLTRDYQLTYVDDDLPTHYSFSRRSRAGSVASRFQKLVKDGRSTPTIRPSKTTPDRSRIRNIVDSLDERGIWLDDKPLRFHKQPGPSIQMAVVVERLNMIADFLSATR